MNTNIAGFKQGDVVTLTRTPAGVGDPSTYSVTGRLVAIIAKNDVPSGGTIQGPDGPVTLDLDAERMQRLYGVTQTLTLAQG